MSGESKNNVAGVTSIAAFDMKRVMAVCGDVTRTGALIEWMDALTEENVMLMSAIAESGDEERLARLSHLASQISVYRRIKDAAQCALDSANGQPPNGGLPEPAGSDPL